MRSNGMQAINELIQAAIDYDEERDGHNNKLAKIQKQYLLIREQGINHERAIQFIKRCGDWQKRGLAYEQLRMARKFGLRPHHFLYFETNKQSQVTLEVIARLVYSFTKRLMLERFGNSFDACQEIKQCIITDPYLRVYYMRHYHGLTADEKQVGYVFSFPEVVELQTLNGHCDEVFQEVLSDQFHDLIFYVFKNKPLDYVIKLFLNIILLIHEHGLEAVITSDYFRMMTLIGNDLLPRNNGDDAEYQEKLRNEDGSRHIGQITHEYVYTYYNERIQTTFMFPEMYSKIHDEMLNQEYTILHRQINNHFPILTDRDMFGLRAFAFQNRTHVSMLFDFQHNNLNYDYNVLVQQVLSIDVSHVETLDEYLGIEDDEDNFNDDFINDDFINNENFINGNFDDEDFDFDIDPDDSEGAW